MSLTKITNFVDTGEDRLNQFHKDRISVKSVLSTFIAEVQQVEDAMFDVYTNCGIFTAISAQLDVVGLIVGELRSGRADDVYRIAILARIRLNIGAGEPNTIIDAIKQLMNPTIIDFTEPYPAYFSIFIQAAINIPNIASIVKEISPVGVSSTVTTLPAGLKRLILSEVRGQPADFNIQSIPMPAALDSYAVSVADTLTVEDLGVFSFPDGGVLAEVYLTKSTLSIDVAGAPYDYDLGDGSQLDLKLIDANQDYTVSIFGGKLSEVRT